MELSQESVGFMMMLQQQMRGSVLYAEGMCQLIMQASLDFFTGSYVEK